MEVSDWITLGAIIVALGIGVASILHTQSLQTKERRERLLNEIIDWAMEATRSKIEGIFKDLAKDDRYLDKKFIQAQIHEIRITYSNLTTKTAYICEVTKSFDSDMGNNAKNTFVNIIIMAQILDELAEVWGQKEKAEIEEYFEVLQKYENELKSSANKVIERASKIKVKGV